MSFAANSPANSLHHKLSPDSDFSPTFSQRAPSVARMPLRVRACVLLVFTLFNPILSQDDDIGPPLPEKVWFNFQCYEARVPTNRSLDLCPQLFVTKPEWKKSFLRVHVSKFLEKENFSPADVICTSNRESSEQKPLRIPCPFLHGAHDVETTHWTFKRSPTSPWKTEREQDPALRRVGDHLDISYLHERDEGTYTCRTSRINQVWTEEWKISRLHGAWTLFWTGPYGDYKAFTISDEGRVAVLPFEEEPWLEENYRLLHHRDIVNGLDFLKDYEEP